jgi:hypothetical protein
MKTRTAIYLGVGLLVAWLAWKALLDAQARRDARTATGG